MPNRKIPWKKYKEFGVQVRLVRYDPTKGEVLHKIDAAKDMDYAHALALYKRICKLLGLQEKSR